MEAPARDYGLAKKRLFGEKTGNRELIKKKEAEGSSNLWIIFNILDYSLIFVLKYLL
jgi:hypothetical protein